MKKLFISLALLISLSISCDNGDSPTGPTEREIIEITTDVTVVTTWAGDYIYVIKKWSFYVMNTLTIEAGAIIKFTPDGPDLTLGNSGTIVANGTNENPIIFTSYKDDAHGGDTNGDGSATTPSPRDWGSINTNGLNGSVFNYCQFYYGGSGSYRVTLNIYDSRATVTNCIFAYNDGSYVWYSTLDASWAHAGTVIQNNIFYDNVKPLTIGTEFSLDNSNTFHNPANISEGNDYNGIYIYSTDHITSDIIWGETEVAFIIDDGDFWVNSGASLTLENNVVLKFKSGSTLLLADGASALVNHDGAGVYFTSYKDDSKKGDTNGDGNATSPADGDWTGIYDDSFGTLYPYYFTWSNILYDSY